MAFAGLQQSGRLPLREPVQYLNAMGVVVLDTLEIGDVPVALRALPQDLEDSTARLAALLDRVTEEGG